MALFVLGIAVAMTLGFLLVRKVWPTSLQTMPLIAVLALPSGLALTSVLYFFWLIVSGGRSGWYPVVETGLLTAALILWSRRGRDSRRHSRRFGMPALSALLSAVLLATAALCFSIPARIEIVNPWGRWDAWSRINLKARFLFAGGDHWTWILTSSSIPHNEYPLLVEATVARAWQWMGGISSQGPQFMSLLWGGLSLLVLYSLVSWLRGPLVAAIVSLGYLTFTPLLFLSSIQYADIPLTCYLMLGCGMMVAAQTFPAEATRFYFFAGLFGGAAAWCKQEGVVFLFLVSLWWLLAVRGGRRERWRAAGWFLAGIGPAGCAALVLKVASASMRHQAAGFTPAGPSMIDLMLDGERHRIILEKLWQGLVGFWNGWPLFFLVIALVLHQLWRRPRVAHPGTLICTAALAASYYLVYLTTRYNLPWHVDTSLNRLMGQLWPLMLMGVAVLFEEIGKTAHDPLLGTAKAGEEAA